MKNFNLEFIGFKNMWKVKGGSVTLYSGGWEIYYSQKKFHFMTLHLWLFGFQIFELVLVRKKK